MSAARPTECLIEFIIIIIKSWQRSSIVIIIISIIIIIIIILFSTHRRSHLDHPWLLSDLSFVAPPISPCAVVRISARGFCYRVFGISAVLLVTRGLWPLRSSVYCSSDALPIKCDTFHLGVGRPLPRLQPKVYRSLVYFFLSA